MKDERDRADSAFARFRNEFLAGVASGVTTSVLGHPLDVVKTRMQIHMTEPGSSAKSLSSIQVIQDIYSSQRLSGFYRGITANLIGGTSSWGLFFALKDKTERVFLASDGLQWYHFSTSATVAGFATQIITNPIWVVKTRMMSTDRDTPSAYRTTAAAFRGIYREGGIKLFYSGCFTSFAGVLQGSVQFTMYDKMKQNYRVRKRAARGLSPGDDESDKIEIGVGPTVAMSTISKVASTVAFYPYQVIRSRLQAHDGAARFGSGIMGVSKGLWKEAGFRGFYKGLIPGVARVLPGTWAIFVSYEHMITYFTRREDQEKSM